MYGEQAATQQNQPRCWWLSRDSVERARQSGVSGSFAPCQVAPARNGEAVPRGRQRALDRDAGVSRASGLDFVRHDSAGQAGVAASWIDLRDGKGATTESSELVRIDVADVGSVGWVRRGGGSGLRSKRVPKNTVLTPGDGVESTPIAPGDGVETVSPTPPDGAIEAVFATLPTPPDGDPLEKPSTRAISRTEVQR